MGCGTTKRKRRDSGELQLVLQRIRNSPHLALTWRLFDVPNDMEITATMVLLSSHSESPAVQLEVMHTCLFVDHELRPCSVSLRGSALVSVGKEAILAVGARTSCYEIDLHNMFQHEGGTSLRLKSGADPSHGRVVMHLRPSCRYPKYQAACALADLGDTFAVLCVGGEDNPEGKSAVHRACECYDYIGHKWSDCPELFVPLKSVAVFAFSRTLYVTGDIFPQVERLSLSSPCAAWEILSLPNLSVLPEPCRFHACVIEDSGTAVLFSEDFRSRYSFSIYDWELCGCQVEDAGSTFRLDEYEHTRCSWPGVSEDGMVMMLSSVMNCYSMKGDDTELYTVPRKFWMKKYGFVPSHYLAHVAS